MFYIPMKRLFPYVSIPCITVLSLAATAQPIITSVNPISGSVSTTVTITGSGFNTTSSSNTVYVGGVKASVSGASNTSLHITIPAGTSPHLPITVTNSGLTAYAPVLFNTTFAGGTTAFNSGSFIQDADIASPNGPKNLTVGDMDGDGKIDMITVNENAASFSIYKNTSTASTTNFTTRIDFPTYLNMYTVDVGDIDGDGLLDIVLASATGSLDSIQIYRNTSSGGILSFALAATYAAPSAYKVTIGDLDGDGKPDIVTTANPGVTIFRNTTTAGAISFTNGSGYGAGVFSQDVALVDVNGNGKADIITCSSNNVYILNNNSTPGNMAFGTAVSFFAGSSPVSVAIGDLNNDGKPDIAVSDFSGSKVNVLKNSGAGSGIAFDAPLSLNTGRNCWGIKMADMNGDGKKDIITTIYDLPQSVMVFKNNSVSSLSFDASVSYNTGGKNRGLVVADFRNTGLPDIAVLKYDISLIALLRNKMVEPPVISSFSPSAAGQGFLVTIKGSNLANVTSVSFGGVPATVVNTTSDTSITAMVGTGASGSISVTNAGGTASKPGFTFTVAAVLGSITPINGPVGQTVKITGSSFASSPNDNAVYFGGSKGIVTSATPSKLYVTVPAGAMHKPIAVTSGGYTRFSQQAFDITFPNGSLNNTTFIKQIIQQDRYYSSMPKVSLADIDGDGLTDIVVPQQGSTLSGLGINDSFAVYRNTTVNGVLSFAPPAVFALTSESASNSGIGDLDGDGKLDVMIAMTGGSVDVFRNTSVPGIISFVIAPSLLVPGLPSQIEVNDLDGDGKADLAVGAGDYTLHVFKNSSVGSNISFAPRQDYTLSYNSTQSVCLSDIDGDGKVDLISPNYLSDSMVILRNTGTPGTISFAAPFVYHIGINTSFALARDMDGDGKNDLVLASGIYDYPGFNMPDTLIILVKNLSTPGNFVFGTPVSYPVHSPSEFALADFDGDGKPDVVTVNNDSTAFVFKNTSTPGSLSLAPKIIYSHTDNFEIKGVGAGDLDGDGKPDFVTSSNTPGIITAFINQNGSEVALCGGDSITLIANIVGAVYQWQVNMGSGFINITDNVYYSGTNTAALVLYNIPSSWQGYQYRCLVNGKLSKVFTLRFANQWTGAVSSAWENPGNWSCGTVPDINTNVVIVSGLAPVTISSNVTIKSLRLDPDVVFTVNTPYTITITN